MDKTPTTLPALAQQRDCFISFTDKITRKHDLMQLYIKNKADIKFNIHSININWHYYKVNHLNTDKQHILKKNKKNTMSTLSGPFEAKYIAGNKIYKNKEQIRHLYLKPYSTLPYGD